MTLIFHGKNDNKSEVEVESLAKHLLLRTPWITAIAPTSEELAELTKLGFDADALQHALDPEERPRLRIRSGSTLAVLRAPWFETGKPHTTFTIGIILEPAGGLTICDRDAPLISKLVALVDRERIDHRNVQHRMLLHALELIAESFLEHLARINLAVDEVEARLQLSLDNREVLALLDYQKSLMRFAAALDAMAVMLERVEKTPALRSTAEDAEWVEDVVTELRQALETSTLANHVLSEMMDAFASIISNNLNRVMKFLASATIVLTIPVAIASFYGMNVELPGQRSPIAFVTLIIVSLVMSIAITVVFRRRSWL